MDSAQKSHPTRSRAFTLIEVLVVIGILGILATVALVAINPAEAQKKARDTQRLKDMATLQAMIEQYLSDNPGAIPAGWSAALTSSSGTKACATNWLSVNLCAYANIIPVDPSNRAAQVSKIDGTSQNKNAYYYFNYTNGAYKICTYLESTSNKEKTRNTNDGGTLDNAFEVYSDKTIACGATD